MKPCVIFIVGPTASGKSAFAVELACHLNGEIISADSMQVYKGMDIGTAKLLPRQRKGVRHHLISILSPTRSFSAFEYRKWALKAIEEIVRRRHVPIVVGGTGLYIQLLLKGLSGQPGRNSKYRKHLEQEAQKKGLEFLYRKLHELDPERACAIQPNDKRRIIRALEILKTSGRKASSWYSRQGQSLEALGYRPILVGLTRERKDLYAQIDKRVDEMFEKGFLKEVDRLSKKKISPTAAQAVGYKELRMALKGEISLEQAKEMIKLNTRRLAKRQLTWFRREKEIKWFSWHSNRDFSLLVLRELRKFYRAS